MIAAWTCGSRGPATTTRGRPGSSNPGSRPTPTAWTTWSGCAGRTASCALAATTPVGGWAVGDGRYKCAGCGARTSVTAGTLFDRRRTPLTVWFTACWMFASQKDSVSALSLQRTLEIGSYATAWAMLHRLRSVLVRPPRTRPPDRQGGGGRDLHRRRGTGTQRRPGQGQEIPCGSGSRGPRAPWLRPGPDGHHRGCLGGLPAPVHHRERRAGRHRHHRRLAGL